MQLFLWYEIRLPEFYRFRGSSITLNLLRIIFPVSEISSVHERTVWLFDWMRLLFLLIIGGSCHRYHFCCDKSFVVKKLCSSWQNILVMFCHDKTFVTTNICHVKHNCVATRLVATSILLLQQTFVFVITKHVFCCEIKYACHDKTCCDENLFVATKVLSSRFSHDKFYHDKPTFVVTKDVFFHDKHVFVVTKHLSQQKLYLWHLPPMILAL